MATYYSNNLFDWIFHESPLSNDVFRMYPKVGRVCEWTIRVKRKKDVVFIQEGGCPMPYMSPAGFKSREFRIIRTLHMANRISKNLKPVTFEEVLNAYRRFWKSVVINQRELLISAAGAYVKENEKYETLKAFTEYQLNKCVK